MTARVSGLALRSSAIPNLPTHGAQGLNCHRLHVGLDAVEDESGAHDVTGVRIPERSPIFRQPHFATRNERNGVWKLTSFD